MNDIRIGQYRFSKNLGNGSFGKVKSKFTVSKASSQPVSCQA